MSIYGTMKTAVSGMNAQANRLSTVGDNIANANTTAYKKVSTAFATFVLPNAGTAYNSGGVTTTVTNSISQQGTLTPTTSETDLAISGEGFFAVQDASGTSYLTRVGSFALDESGYLVNANGFTLLGTSIGGSVNTFSDMEPIQIKAYEVTAVPTTKASVTANLEKTATAPAAATRPSAAGTTASATVNYNLKTSMTTYDAGGSKVVYDLYYTKTADQTWELSIFDHATADASSSTGFPYSAGPVTTRTLTFNTTNFGLDSVSGSTDMTVDVNGIKIDLTAATQLDTDSFSKVSADGSAPSSLQKLTVDDKGIVYAVYESGNTAALAQIALGTVVAPDNLEMSTGNVYSVTSGSGAAIFGFPGEPGFGVVESGSLESSNVDLASELTEMIEAQRSYTANSKVFQTGADVMDVLINLKR